MGAKAPEKLKLRRQQCSCEVCGRSFVNVQALTSHRKYMHKAKPVPARLAKVEKDSKRRPMKKIPPQPEVKAPQKKEKIAAKSESKVSVEKRRKVSTQSDTKAVEKKSTIKVIDKELVEANKMNSSRKIQFRCPKCICRNFVAYFSAYRHIQKYHCVDSKDNPVPANSPLLIKPIRFETCLFCQASLEVGEEHTCATITDHIAEIYMCLGCQQTFDSLLLFEHHVKGLHATGAEYYFFPTKDEFSAWKTELESTVKIKYLTLTATHNSKEIYHCSHQPALKTEKTLLCPSSLCLTEFKSGYQVIYYKEHFGHTCTEMTTTKFKKFLVNPYLTDADGLIDENKDDSVYQQFKNIMNSITATAAKVDIGMLNTLLGKALEMSVMLNGATPEEHATVNKSMTDEQISDVLAEVKTYPGKRKAESLKKDVKKAKPTLEIDGNDENSKSNNTLPPKATSKPVNKKPTESLPSTPLARPVIQSPSFNDTYKDFVDQNFSKLNDSSTPVPKTKSNVKKKVVMKTKMGQFKTRPSLSPKDTTETKVKPMSPKPPKKSEIKTIEKIIEYKFKPDIQYEVKEQENDCNILILKI